ncbi:hypothetical protein AB6E21_16525 [Photobacterium swingsii]|uniref:hypothetical protein n=1 Tax=Photobacterium swingsii TaxID=680026 RepID=UPI00354F62C9
MTDSHTFTARFVKSICTALLIAASAISLQATASPVSTDSYTEQQRIANKVGVIQQELAAIKQETLQANPKLRQQQLEFEKAFEAKAEQVGYDPDAFMAKAKEIQDELRAAGTTQEQQAKLIKEFSHAKSVLAKQRETIMSDEALMDKEEDLRKATYIAMTKHDPKTKELFGNLDQLLKQMQ